MNPISCQQCGGINPFHVQPDGLFKCHECGDLLDRRDIDLDGQKVWAVDSDGILGYVTDPAASLAEMAQAVEDYLSADESNYGHLAALNDYNGALITFLEARRAGIADPPNTFTRDQVADAVNQGADIVLESLYLAEPEKDAINLVVNAAITCLDAPGSSFEDVLSENYGETPDEVRSWWGWTR